MYVYSFLLFITPLDETQADLIPSDISDSGETVLSLQVMNIDYVL